MSLTYSKTLEDFTDDNEIYPDGKDAVTPSFKLGEAVRNVSYKMVQEDKEHLGECQRMVLECLLKHPKGLNDKTIAKETGLPKTSVCARRNELMSLGLVSSGGVGYFPDYRGRLRANTLWVIKNNGGGVLD